MRVVFALASSSPEVACRSLTKATEAYVLSRLLPPWLLHAFLFSLLTRFLQQRRWFKGEASTERSQSMHDFATTISSVSLRSWCSSSSFSCLFLFPCPRRDTLGITLESNYLAQAAIDNSRIDRSNALSLESSRRSNGTFCVVRYSRFCVELIVKRVTV